MKYRSHIGFNTYLLTHSIHTHLAYLLTDSTANLLTSSFSPQSTYSLTHSVHTQFIYLLIETTFHILPYLLTPSTVNVLPYPLSPHSPYILTYSVHSKLKSLFTQSTLILYTYSLNPQSTYFLTHSVHTQCQRILTISKPEKNVHTLELTWFTECKAANTVATNKRCHPFFFLLLRSEFHDRINIQTLSQQRFK